MDMLENWTINFKKNCHNWLPFLAWFYSNHKVASHWPEWKERQRSAEERTEDTEACWWPKISIQTYTWGRGGTGSNLKNTRQRRRGDYHEKLQKFHLSRLTTRVSDNIRTEKVKFSVNLCLTFSISIGQYDTSTARIAPNVVIWVWRHKGMCCRLAGLSHKNLKNLP